MPFQWYEQAIQDTGLDYEPPFAIEDVTFGAVPDQSYLLSVEYADNTQAPTAVPQTDFDLPDSWKMEVKGANVGQGFPPTGPPWISGSASRVYELGQFTWTSLRLPVMIIATATTIAIRLTYVRNVPINLLQWRHRIRLVALGIVDKTLRRVLGLATGQPRAYPYADLGAHRDGGEEWTIVDGPGDGGL